MSKTFKGHMRLSDYIAFAMQFYSLCCDIQTQSDLTVRCIHLLSKTGSDRNSGVARCDIAYFLNKSLCLKFNRKPFYPVLPWVQHKTAVTIFHFLPPRAKYASYIGDLALSRTSLS